VLSKSSAFSDDGLVALAAFRVRFLFGVDAAYDREGEGRGRTLYDTVVKLQICCVSVAGVVCLSRRYAGRENRYRYARDGRLVLPIGRFALLSSPRCLLASALLVREARRRASRSDSTGVLSPFLRNRSNLFDIRAIASQLDFRPVGASVFSTRS